MAGKLILLVTLAACSSHAGPTFVRCDEGICVSDPTPHCIAETGCENDASCMAGLTCTTQIGDLPSCGVTGVDDVEHCRWSPPRMRRAALSNGFLTRSMTLRVIANIEPELEWSSPPTAKLVSCALFRCNPEIGLREGNDSSDTSPTGSKLRRILNADACIIDRDVYDASRTGAVLPFTHSDPIPGTEPQCERGQSYSRHIYNFIAAGCWAYDDHDIIAASDLISVPPTMFEALGRGIPVSDACQVDDIECFDPVRGFFGLCGGGQCRPFCTSALDCQSAGAQLFNEPISETCNWECRTVPRSPAGVCYRTDVPPP